MKPIFALTFALAVGSLQAQTWKSLGPAPIGGGFNGRVSAIACSATNANKIYVGGADGGVWKTTDGGTTWTRLTDSMPTTAIGAIAVDPTNDNIVYVGTGEANYANHSRYGLGLYKTTDGGTTWTQYGATTFGGRTFSKLVINPQNTQVLYASIAAAGGFPEKSAAKGHPGANGPMGIFKSTDGGATWTQLTNGIPNQAATDVSLVGVQPSTLYAGIGRPFGAAENGIYKSTDSGASWTKLSGGLATTNVGRVNLCAAANDINRVYALFVNKCDASGNNGSTLAGYTSTNGGATWTTVPVGSFQATYGWYLSAVSVKPTNPALAVYAGFDLLRTSNFGSSFSTITTQHVDNHCAAWDASGRLWAGCDGGLFRSTNDGTSWTNLNSGISICQFYAAISISPNNPNFVLGGLQDNGTVVRTTDNTNWANFIGGDGGYTVVDQANPNRMFAQYQGSGNIFISTNGGSSWNSAGNGINGGDRNAFFSPIEIDPTNSNRVLLGTYRMYRSTNGGTSWSAISGDLSNGSGSVRSLSISKTNPQVVWATTTDGNVSRSIDGGVTFTKILTGIPGWSRVTREITIDPYDSQTVYLTVSNFGTDQVRRTKNGGTSWESLDGDLPDVPVNVVVADKPLGKRMIFAGTDDGVYRSMDDGAHWTRYGQGLPRCCVIDIKLDLPRKRMVVGTQGRGAYEVPLIATAKPS